MNPGMIAPCGMNCELCLAHLRKKNVCNGCLMDDDNKPRRCVACSIKNCEHNAKSKSGMCYECPKYPCRRLKQLDKRYRTKYNMSMIDNLEFIKEYGLGKFISKEEEKWACNNCGGVICVHRGFCLSCN